VRARREYNIGLRCELERKTDADNAKRGCELAAYFTHTKLQPAHLVLSLRSAMNASFKLKCYATSATFCRRMLELSLPAKARAPRPPAPPLHRHRARPWWRAGVIPSGSACGLLRRPEHGAGRRTAHGGLVRRRALLHARPPWQALAGVR